MEMDQQLLELPLESMPRERLEKLGAKSLETYELLAILLRTGSKELNVLQLAKVVLNTFEDLFTLKMATVEELMAIHGIGRTKAIELKAANSIRNSKANKIRTYYKLTKSGRMYYGRVKRFVPRTFNCIIFKFEK